MKIIELCLSENLGGLELYFLKTCAKLSGLSAVLPVVKGSSRLEQLIITENLTFISFQEKNLFRQAQRLRALISQEKIDIVHVHHKDDLPLCVLTKFISRKKFKLVHTRQMGLPKRKKDLYHRLIYSQTDLLIAITRQLQQDATINLPMKKNRITQLYYGVSASAPGPSPFKDEENKFRLGVFSRIGPKKGQHVLLSALKILKEKNIAPKLHIYGEVMDENYYERLMKIIAENDLADVHFKGFHPNPVSIMAYYDAVIVPSLNETFGLVAVEGMLAETVVIATNKGGLQEIIEHEKTGLLFEPENSKDLATQLERVLCDHEWRRNLAENGRKIAEERFDEASHYEKLLALMERTLTN